MKWLVLICISFIVVNCSNHGSGGSGGPGFNPGRVLPPFETKIEEVDRDSFDNTRSSKAKEQFDRQVAFLKLKGHDIEWFPQQRSFNVNAHKTVQLIYFGYSDRVISWCSGSIFDGGHIASAAHCNSRAFGAAGSGTKPGDSPVNCEGKVVFAYKPTEASPVRYFGCKEVKVSVFEKTDWIKTSNYGDDSVENNVTWEQNIKDFTLFSIAFHDLKYSQAFVGSKFDAELSSKKYVSTSGTQPAVGVVVDPPVDRKTYRFRFDSVIGVLDKVSYPFARDDMYSTTHFILDTQRYSDRQTNETEPGNSGSPVYVLTDSNNREITTEVGSDIDIDGGSWKYVSSLYGGYVMKDGRDFSIYTRPYIFHDDYFKLIK